MAEIYEIADAVVVALNALSPFGSIEFTAFRSYVPLLDMSGIGSSEGGGNSSSTVVVVATEDDIDLISRDDTGLEHIRIEVGMLFKLPATIDPTSAADNLGIDPFLKLGRAIAMLFIPGETIEAGGSAIQWLHTKWPLMFESQKLKNERIFQSVITFTFVQ